MESTFTVASIWMAPNHQSHVEATYEVDSTENVIALPLEGDREVFPQNSRKSPI